ncbi:MAG: hypothetical protein WCN98_06605 [Verrucomicrobiaceae bacterium]
MKRSIHLALAALLCHMTGCVTSFPDSVDGKPVTQEEKVAYAQKISMGDGGISNPSQYIRSPFDLLALKPEKVVRELRRKKPPPPTVDGVPLTGVELQAAQIARYGELGEFGYGLTPLKLQGQVNGVPASKRMTEAVRKFRQTKGESVSLTQEINEAREHNQKLAAHCTELLREVDALSGKPHSTLDQRKDVLEQIKQQMSRMDYAGKQTDQAIRANGKILASVKSSGAGHDKEMKDLQAQIQSLQSEKTMLAEKNAKLAQMHKEISSQ